MSEPRIDPVVTEIIRNGFIAATEEMRPLRTISVVTGSMPLPSSSISAFARV